MWQLLGIFIFFHYLVGSGGPLTEPNSCRSAIESKPNLNKLMNRSVEVSSTYLRTIKLNEKHKHWASAIVLRTADLNKRPVTIVCDFGERSNPWGFGDLELEKFEYYEGDKLDDFVDISVSNFNPIHRYFFLKPKGPVYSTLE